MRNVILITLAFVTALAISTFGRPSDLPAKGKRLIKVSQHDDGQWLSEDEILILKRTHDHFVDVIDANATQKRIIPNEDRIPEELLYHSATSNAISKLNLERMRTFLEKFTSYFNRMWNSETGVATALWLLSEIENSISDSRYNGTASVRTVEHSWLQPSIIARIDGADATLATEVVIIGSHLDSLNFIPTRPAPGADDDGSGSAALLESLRALLYSDFIPKRTIEFQWYAAEEVGLLGSGAIARQYNDDGVDIVSMLNFDVTGYNAGRKQIGINTDFVNEKLNTFVRMIVDEHLDYGWANRSCGYACSDHASFFYFGYITAFPSELEFFHEWHTEQDTVDIISFEQLIEFSKLGVSYAVEMAQPHVA